MKTNSIFILVATLISCSAFHKAYDGKNDTVLSILGSDFKANVNSLFVVDDTVNKFNRIASLSGSYRFNVLELKVVDRLDFIGNPVYVSESFRLDFKVMKAKPDIIVHAEFVEYMCEKYDDFTLSRVTEYCTLNGNEVLIAYLDPNSIALIRGDYLYLINNDSDSKLKRKLNEAWVNSWFEIDSISQEVKTVSLNRLYKSIDCNY